MRKIFILSSFILLCFSIGLKAQEVEYHFQEGFENTKPSGWTRTCGATMGATNGLVHVTDPALPFAGANAIKFDNTCTDETKCLETPISPNAGILSFYAARNANNVLMDLHILKIVDGEPTEIKLIDVNAAISHKNNGWTKISIPVNETKPVKFKFYVTLRDPGTPWFAIDDMELTKYSENTDPEEPGKAIDKVDTDFNNAALWGEPYTSAPSPFPTYETESGFKLVKAFLQKGNSDCPAGGRHTMRISVDKSSNGGSVELPLLKDVGEIEIHAHTGSANMSFRLDEFINDGWNPIGTYQTKTSPDSIYIIPLNRATETKLRIANNTGSGLLIYKIITRTLKETTELNITTTTPAEGTTCYYNLTNNVTLTFNREIAFGTGDITLNGVNIPLNTCSIDEKNVTVPVVLEGGPSGINYTMTIPEGAFIDKENPEIKSNAKAFMFQTYKTVKYPDGYASKIDVVYSGINHPQNRMDIYYPTSSEKPVPLLINMHGGGWSSGEKEAQGGFNLYFDMGFAVANVEYRMTPHALAPAAVVDVRSAMLYLIDHAEELNIDPTKIVFQGGSAGGHLALTAGYLMNNNTYDYGYTPKARNASAIDEYKIIAVIDKYGPADLNVFKLVYGPLQRWLGDKIDDVEFVNSISPVDMVTADTPPTYIIHGDADPTVQYVQSEILVAALQAANVKYQFTTVPDGLHGGFPATYNTQMNEEITAFLKGILDIISSVDSEKADQDIKISLKGNNLEISIDGDAKTEIFDISGRKLISTSSKQIQMPQHSTGVLVVKVATEAGIYVKKILK